MHTPVNRLGDLTEWGVCVKDYVKGHYLVWQKKAWALETDEDALCAKQNGIIMAACGQ